MTNMSARFPAYLANAGGSFARRAGSTKAGALGGSNAGVNLSVNATQGDGTTYRIQHLTPLNRPLVRPILSYANFRLAPAETNGPNDIYVTAAIEYNGASYPCFLNGQRQVTIKPEGEVDFEEVNIIIPANTIWYERVYVSVPTGGVWPVGRGLSATSSEGWQGKDGADVTASVGTGTMTSGVYAYGASAISSAAPSSTTPALLLLTDSIGSGQGESVVEATKGSFGFLERGVSNTLPWHSCGRSNQKVALFNTSSYRQLSRRARLSTRVISSLGVNDIYQDGVSLATLQARFQTYWNTLSGMGLAVWQCTITPVSASSDGFTTTAGQSTTNAGRDTVWQQANDWIRTLPAPLSGYIEVADVVTPGRNVCQWAPAASARALPGAGITATSAVLTVAGANFTAADQYTTVYIPGAGSSGAGLAAVINTITSSTTVTLDRVAVTTVAGAAAKCGGLTLDGVHPLTPCHILMAAPVAASLALAA